MKKVLLLFAFITLCENSFSQDYFEKYYEIDRTDLQVQKLLKAEEDSYYILANATPNGEWDVKYSYLIKADSSGNELWNSSVYAGESGLGFGYVDFAFSKDSFIYITEDELGCTDNSSIIKRDRFSNFIWERQISHSSRYHFTCISSTNTTDLIAGGINSDWTICNNLSAFVCKLDSGCNIIWETDLDSLYPNQLISKIELYHDSTYLVYLTNATIQINDSGQIISTLFPIGKFISLNNGEYLQASAHQVVKLSDSLVTIWTSPIYSDRQILDFTANGQGDIFITGRLDTCNGEIFVSKLDTIGNIVFTKVYGGDLADDGDCILLPDSNHIIVAGTHHIQEWFVRYHHYYDCFTYITYTNQVALIKLNQTPITTSSIQASLNSYHLCGTDSMILSAPAGFNYYWNTGDNSQNIVVDSTGNFQLTISDSAGNQEQLPIFHAYKYPFPALSHFNDSILGVCNGATLDACLQFEYSEFTWDRDFTWWRYGTDLTHSPILFYIQGLTPGVYYCTTSNICGSDTSGNIVIQASQPQVTLGNDTSICITQTITLDPGSGFANYLWQDGSTLETYLASSPIADTVSFNVTITDLNGCTNSDTIQVTFDVCSEITSIPRINQILISPIPSRGNFNIECYSEMSSKVTIIVYDNVGQIIFESLAELKPGINLIPVNIKDVSPGIFSLEFRTPSCSLKKLFSVYK